jgi:hypothetical protein
MIDVVGYEGLYAVDQNGNVWSYRKNILLKPVITGKRYYMVNLCKDRKMRTYTVHRLVAKAFLENYSEDLHVDHIDGNRQNNKLENLRMVTHQENHFNRTKAKGYCWDKNAGKWHAQITLNGKNKNLGYFNTEAEARDAYLEAKKIMHII